MSAHALYLGEAICSQDVIISIVTSALRDIEYEGLVGTGLSGTLVVPLMAYLLKKRFCIVRKASDNGRHNHSEFHMENGLQIGDRWVFIDDFVSSGETRTRVMDIMRNVGAGKYEYVGAYMYSNDTWAASD